MDANVQTIVRQNQAARLLLLATLLIGGCKKPSSTSPEPQKTEARKVRVHLAQKLPTEETVYATGALAARERAVLSAKVAGRVETVLADLGSAAKQGDVLVRIEVRDYELKRQQSLAALAQARARLGLSLSGEEDRAEPEKTSIVKEARALLAEAAKNRDRVLRLREEGVIPDADVETAEAGYLVAMNRHEEAVHEAKTRIATLQLRRAELESAEQELKDTEIRAPFDGVVEHRQTSPGEFLNVGAPIVTVVSIDPIRLRLEISEKDAPRVRIGQKVHLEIGGSGKSHQGKISRVSPVITADNRMLRAEADVANPNGVLRPGSFAKAFVVVDDQGTGVFVPGEAVISFAGIQKIFVVQGGKAVEKAVDLGSERESLVEIIGALKGDEQVILEPGNLRNGQPVEVIPRDS